MKLKPSSLLFWVLLFVVVACKKSDSSNTPGDNGGAKKISGSVTLPAGSSVNVNGLIIRSASYSAAVNNGSYSIDTFSFNYSTTFATDATDNIVMMRYNYPGQPDNNITAQTTALALLMNNGAVFSLTDAGKLNLITTISNHPDFMGFVTEITTAIKSGINYLQADSASSIVLAASRLFTTTSTLRTQDFNTPVKIERATSSKTVSFTSQTACTYVIGVYKNNDPQPITKLELKGAQLYPTSIKEFFQGFVGTLYGDVQTVQYEMTTDGSYQFKIRSGFPALSNNTDEVLEAFRANVLKAIMDMVAGGLGVNPSSDCHQAIRANAVQWLRSINNLPTTTNSLGDFCSVIHDIAAQFFQSTNNIFDCVKDKAAMNKYVVYIKRVARFLDLVGKAGTVLNVTAHSLSWFKTKAVIDTCLNVAGNTVTPCALQISLSRNGKVITATATGGTPPYSYKMDNGGRLYTSYGSSNTFTLSYNGYYSVTVQDASGNTALAGDGIEDIIVTSVSSGSLDPLSDPSRRGFLIVSYTSSLGLKPGAFGPVVTTPSGAEYRIPGYILSSNNPFYMPLSTCLINGVGGMTWISGFGQVSGNDFARTVQVVLVNNANTLSPVNITLRLNKAYNSGWTCGPGNGQWSDNIYTISW